MKPLRKKIRVVVGSINPVKIKSVKNAFSKYFKKIEIIWESVESGVSRQPKSEGEMIEGAKDRANKSLLKVKGADFGIGIEGGLEYIKNIPYTFAWIAIKSRGGKIGLGRTASFPLPKKIKELIDLGKELGEANDIIFGIKNSKQKMGAIGLLSKNKLDRKKLYEQGVICALIPFLNKELF